MITVDLTLHAETTTELAEQLTAIANDINTQGGNALPAPGDENTVLVSRKVVGAMSRPGIVTDADRASLARAALAGDCRTLDRVATAQIALVKVLQYQRLDDFTRDGLLIAMDELASKLADRANFLEHRYFTPGVSHGDE
ncbi:hypothetical protein ACLUEY_02120 [Vreelandella aquamarina]